METTLQLFFVSPLLLFPPNQGNAALIPTALLLSERARFLTDFEQMWITLNGDLFLLHFRSPVLEPLGD